MIDVKKSACWAAVGCALWLVGFDVLPLAHMVFHEAFEEHHHGHDRASRHRHDEAPSPTEHGEGSVAHRDLAAQVPPPAVPDVLEALVAPNVRAAASHDERPTDRRPRARRARAPPAPET